MGKNGVAPPGKPNPCLDICCAVTLAVTVTLSVTLAITLSIYLTYKLNLEMTFSRHSSSVITTRNGSCCDSRYDVGYEKRPTRNNRRNQRVDYEPAYPAYDYYLTWPRLFGQNFRFDKWNVCRG